MKKIIELTTDEVIEIVVKHLKVKPTKEIIYNPLVGKITIEYEDKK